MSINLNQPLTKPSAAETLPAGSRQGQSRFQHSFSKETGQSEARHRTVGSQSEPPSSTKRWPESKSLSCCSSLFSQRKRLHSRHEKKPCWTLRPELPGSPFQWSLLEKICPERLEVLVAQLPSNIIGCLSNPHIPECVLLNIPTAEEAARVPAVERSR